MPPRPATVLVAGATGTVGSRVVEALPRRAPAARIVRGTRAPAGPDDRAFDLTDPAGVAAALGEVDAAFLMLPPGLPNAGDRFGAALARVPVGRLPYVAFLSVQGADQRSFLPHAHVERALRARAAREPGLPRFAFLRPAYFMQNLETAFGRDIRERAELVAPLGRARLVWIDAADVARAAAVVLANPAPHAGHAYALTGADRAGFAEVASLLTRALGYAVTYRSPHPLAYFLRLRRRGVAAGRAAAQTAIHFAERFTADAPQTPDYELLTGRRPTSLTDYVARAFGESTREPPPRAAGTR